MDSSESHDLERLDALAAKLRDARTRHKAQERPYSFPDIDVPWWTDTPPGRVWTHGGVLCAISAAPSPGLNGYVRLPPGHPWHELDLQLADANSPDVHGDITFGPHVTGWIGFDTIHGFDHWPAGEVERLRADGLVPDEQWRQWEQWRHMRESVSGDPFSNTHDRHLVQWSLERVLTEVTSLAEQVAASTPGRVSSPQG